MSPLRQQWRHDTSSLSDHRAKPIKWAGARTFFTHLHSILYSFTSLIGRYQIGTTLTGLKEKEADVQFARPYLCSGSNKGSKYAFGSPVWASLEPITDIKNKRVRLKRTHFEINYQS